MSAILLPINRIENFRYEVLRAPVHLQAIESAKKSFQDLLRYSDDPVCAKALSRVKMILELKEEQAILKSKIETAIARFRQLDQSVRTANPANYETLSQEIDNLKKDLEGLSEEALPLKTPLLERLQIYRKVVEAHNPGAWKAQLLMHSLLAAGIGLFFVANASSASTTGALDDLDNLAQYFNRSICDRNLNPESPTACLDTVSPNVLLGAGILIGFAGVAIQSLKKVSRKALPLLANGAIWAASKVWSEEKETAKNPKLSNQSISPAPFDHIPLKPLPPAKQFAYDKLTQGKAPADPLHFTVHRLADPDILDCKIFQKPKQPLVEKSGPFAFPPSTGKAIHWTADFADTRLLGNVNKPLLEQEELLALEHPVLYHLHEALERVPALQPLAENRIVLMANVGRYGALRDLDGKEFASSSLEAIDAHLDRFEKPVFSNLFAMAAPQNPLSEKEHLKELFMKACTAFTAIANQSASAKLRPIVHTGNFGPSPLAAALCQILAARTAGIELHYYPMNETEAFAKAQKILANIERQAPNACLGEVLVHLALHAKEYGVF